MPERLLRPPAAWRVRRPRYHRLMSDAPVVTLAADEHEQAALRVLQELRALGFVEPVTVESGQLGWRLTAAGQAYWTSVAEEAEG